MMVLNIISPLSGKPTSIEKSFSRAVTCMSSNVELAGNGIRLLRQRRRVSQAKLARLLDVPQAQLSQWELEKLPIPNTVAGRIHAVLGSLHDHDVQTLRKKRYQRHEYASRGSISVRTVHHNEEAFAANQEYLKLLTNLEALRVRQPHTSGLSAVALFAGCGGMSLGFSWADFLVRGFLELKPEFRSIYKANFPDVAEMGGDITKVTNQHVHTWKETLGNIDVLFGGPPCQGFSLTGKRDRLDPRNQLFREVVRIAKILEPRAILLENVRLLTSMKSAVGNLVKDEITEGLQAIGYRVAQNELDAQDYGVPQHRERVFFIALREDLGLKPTFPEPTYGAGRNISLFSPNRASFRTFRTATCDLEGLESGQKSQIDMWHQAVAHPKHVIEWLENVPEGGSAHDNSDLRLRPPSGYNTTYKRLCWDEPSSTISTTFGMISGSRNVHPAYTRSLTVREALRCQSFPDSFNLVGSLGAIRTSIGNAVPPLLAYALAGHLKQLLLYAGGKESDRNSRPLS